MASRYMTLQTAQKLNELDNKAIGIIKAINGLIIEAQNENLTAISSVLEDARESIAWWAVHNDFSQERSERLAHELKLSSGLNIAAALMAKFSTLKDEEIRKEMLQLIQNISL